MPQTLFTATDPAAYDALWTTDGTAIGTRKVAVNSNLALNPADITAAASGLFYFAGNAPGGFNLWVSDGTAAGTREVIPGAAISPNDIAPLGAGVVFGHNGELWVSDGTAAGTHVVTVPGAATNGLFPGSLVARGGRVYFDGASARSVVGGLWVTDGTTGGTMEIPVAGAPFFEPSSIALAGTELVMAAAGGTSHRVLWASDGTTQGTVPLAVAGLNPTGGFSGEPSGITSFGVDAGFVALDAAGGYGIWVTDGTAAGTFELAGVHATSSVVPMVAFGRDLAFVALNAAGVKQVWTTDGTQAGTQAISPVANTGLNAVVAVGGKLLFDGGGNFYLSDGTAAGTAAQPEHVSLSSGDVRISAQSLAGPRFTYFDTTSGQSGATAGDVYAGPVTTLAAQYVWQGADDVVIDANVPNVFLHGSSGNDALQVQAGSNVLDGGFGSNFLVGGIGADGGTDNFFVDSRAPGVTWSTMVNFHQGDSVTLWGFTAASTTQWANNEGAGGAYNGATLHSEIAGPGTGIDASLTLAGLTTADVASKLQVLPGKVGDASYLYIHWA